MQFFCYIYDKTSVYPKTYDRLLITVHREFINNGDNSFFSIIIEYNKSSEISTSNAFKSENKKRIDYRGVKGLPIGNLISQHLANFYLGKFDHWIKEIMKVKHYIRYMDDFILLSNSQCELKKLLDNIIIFLDNQLLLKLKENIQLNKVKHGIPFLGYRVFSEKILLSPQSRKRFIEKYRLYEAKCLHGTWSIDEMVRHMMPLIEFTKKADAHGLRTNVINQFGVWS